MIWQFGKLAGNTVILGASMGLRTLSQALVFLFVARLLGSEGYGAFSATLAIASIWSNFCGLGGHIILVRNIARAPERFPQTWALTLAVLGLGIIPIFLLYLASSLWLQHHVPKQLVITLGLAELVFWPFSNAAAYAYQGLERMGGSARMMLIPVLTRLLATSVLAIGVFFEEELNRLILWGWLYAGAALMAATYSQHRVHRDLGRPKWPSWQPLRIYVLNGLPFAFLGGANKLHVDADKILLVRMLGLEAGGLYSAAYRLVDLAFLPLHALIAAAVPRLFRAGIKGTSHTLHAALPLLGPALAYALIAGVGLFLSAPLIPYFLGPSYEGAAPMIRWLAWLPLVGMPRLWLQRILGTSGSQTLGMMSVLTGATVNVILTLWWIPLWGWQGAVKATYVAEGVMIAILSILVSCRICKR